LGDEGFGDVVSTLRSPWGSVVTAERWGPRHDHYYWLTAILAGRGLQASTCRVIAGIIAALGLIPMIALVSPLGPQGLIGRVLAVLVTTCCAVMSLRWLRHRWPTSTESATCAVVGTVCIAVACLISTSPVAGLLGATSFAILAAYVACFHGLRLLAFTWTVAAVTLTVLAVRLAPLDTALAVSSVFLVALVNVFVALACRVGVRLISGEAATSQLEPLTGLLDRDAFYERTATLLAARHREDDRYLVLVVVNIDGFSLVTSMSGERGGNLARVAVSTALRSSVRHDAVVAHVSDAEFVIADTFTTPDASPLVDRVRAAVTNTPSRLTTSVGVVSTPLRPLIHLPPDDVVDEVLAIATTAMNEARKHGGNRAHFVVNPALTVVGNPDSGGRE
jgi:diguanylate cyclase (GGDEF)-like protein